MGFYILSYPIPNTGKLLEENINFILGCCLIPELNPKKKHRASYQENVLTVENYLNSAKPAQKCKLQMFGLGVFSPLIHNVGV